MRHYKYICSFIEYNRSDAIGTSRRCFPNCQIFKVTKAAHGTNTRTGKRRKQFNAIRIYSGARLRGQPDKRQFFPWDNMLSPFWNTVFQEKIV